MNEKEERLYTANNLEKLADYIRDNDFGALEWAPLHPDMPTTPDVLDGDHKLDAFDKYQKKYFPSTHEMRWLHSIAFGSYNATLYRLKVIEDLYRAADELRRMES